MCGRRSFVVGAVLTLALVLSPSTRADESIASSAEEFVRSLAEAAITELTDANLPVEEQERRFRDIIKEYVAFESIARWVLGGRYWKRADEIQQARYLRLFEDLMVATYAHRFQNYAGETLDITATRVIDAHQALVQSRLMRPGADTPLRVDWRVRESGGKYRIIDIMVEGLSMAQTQRSEFTSVMRGNGGDLNALLDDLEGRLSKARAERMGGATTSTEKS